jgi:hypothetical protein
MLFGAVVQKEKRANRFSFDLTGSFAIAVESLTSTLRMMMVADTMRKGIFKSS